MDADHLNVTHGTCMIYWLDLFMSISFLYLHLQGDHRGHLTKIFIISHEIHAQTPKKSGTEPLKMLKLYVKASDLSGPKLSPEPLK